MIYTSIFNCGEVGRICLDSYHKNHDHPVKIFGYKEDFKHIKKHKNNIYHVTNWPQTGHDRTAYMMAWVSKMFDSEKHIHFDCDIYFKDNIIDYLLEQLDEYEFIGTRRCYTNNPAGIEVDPKIPDALSTYILAFKSHRLRYLEFDDIKDMWRGRKHPFGWQIMDFGDPIIHYILNKGAKVLYLGNEIAGGQDKNGTKNNSFRSNMHFDVGTHLVHFGGAGSGCAIDRGHDIPDKSYRDWAVTRWQAFQEIFYKKSTPQELPIIEKGRWVGGGYSQEILTQLKQDMYE